MAEDQEFEDFCPAVTRFLLLTRNKTSTCTYGVPIFYYNFYYKLLL